MQQEYTTQNFASIKNLNLDPSVITANVAQEVLVVCGCEAFANSCLSPIGKQYLLSSLGAPFGAVATVNTTDICSHTYGTERLCSRRRKGTTLVDHRMGCPHKKYSTLQTSVTLFANDF